MVKSVHVTCPPDLRYTEKKIFFFKIPSWGLKNNYYFSLRALHLFPEETCIAETKTEEQIGGVREIV